MIVLKPVFGSSVAVPKRFFAKTGCFKKRVTNSVGNTVKKTIKSKQKVKKELTHKCTEAKISIKRLVKWRKVKAAVINFLNESKVKFFKKSKRRSLLQ